MTPRGQRLRPEERRQEIVRQALVLADSVGLDRLTTRDIAGSLGIAPGLVHHYFASMDDLVVEAFSQFATTERDRTEQLVLGLPPVDALRAYVTRSLALDSAVARIWMSAWVAAPRRPALAQEIDRQMLADLAALSALLEQGEFGLTDARASAFRVLVLLDGILVQVSMRSEKAIGDVESLVWDTVEREVGLPAGALREHPGPSPRD